MISVNPVDPPILYVTQTINITCQVTTLARFQSGLRIVWYYNGSILNSNGSVSISTMNLTDTTTESTLTFGELVLSNTGAYHCVAQVVSVLNSEEGMSSITNIQVVQIPAPQFIPIQLVTTPPIYVNDVFTLQCNFSTVPNIKPQIVINWYRNGTLLTNSGGDSIVTTNTGNEATSELTVSNSMNIQEDYQCRSTVGASQQTDSDTYTFNFTSPPTPMISINPVDPPDLYVTQTINITCQVTTLARFQSGLSIAWYQNGSILSTNGNVQISIINLDDTTTESTLTFGELVLGNTGAYHCVAQVVSVLNSEEGMSSITNIQVVQIPAPQFIPIQLVTTPPIYVNDVFTLQCNFSTVPNIKPQIVINWYRDGTLLANSGDDSIVTTNTGNEATSELTVSNSMNIQEDYQCRSTVGASQQTVSDTYTFNFTPDTPVPSVNPVDPPILYVTQIINITCQVTTLAVFHSGLRIAWNYNGSILNPNDNVSISTMNLTDTTTESTLTFGELVLSNTGAYHCVAQVVSVLNSEEGMSSITNIQVVQIPAPQFISIQLVTSTPIYVNDTFTLQCLFSTVPNIKPQIVINWYRDGTLLTNSGGDSIVTTNTGNEATSELTVSNSMNIQEDYQCRSTVGASQQTVSDTYTFHFTSPPTPMISVNPVDPPDLYVTQTINIACQVTTLARFQSGLSIVWYQDGSILSTNGSVQISIVNLDDTTTESTLTFLDLAMANTGAYRCTAQVPGVLNSEAVSITTNVQVNQIPAPQFIAIQLETSTPIFVNDTFTLQCLFSTVPNIKPQIIIDWYRNGTLLTNSSFDSIVTTNAGNETTSELTVSNSMNIQGDYQCRSTVGASQQTVSDNYTFNFTPPPTLIQVGIIYRDFEYDLFEGYTFHLHCDFMTLGIFQSMLQIVWYRDNIQIHNSSDDVTIMTVNEGMDTKQSKITIADAKLNDSGAYSCEGSIEPYTRTRSEIYNVTINSTDEIPAIDVSTTDHSTNSITFQLSTNTNIDETYLIYYRPAGTSEPYKVSPTILTLSITIEDLLPGTEYEYIVETTTQFGSTNSTLYIVSTVTQLPPTGYNIVGPIAGAVLALVFLGILVLVAIFLIAFVYRKRDNNKYVFRSQEEYDHALRASDRHRRGERNLITKSTGVELNVGSSALCQKNVEIYDESDGKRTSTFRKSMEVQETVMVNQEQGARAEPLYEDFTYERYNVPIAMFSQRVLEYHLANNAEFDKQYSSFKKTFIHDVTTGSNVVNKPKNRFANIIPYEHSRVKLSFTGENYSDYINACYVDGYYSPQSYIASQGPMPHTIYDFWRMIWEKNIEHIVALTRVLEALKKKCEQYWPENEHESCLYGPMEVTLKRIERYTSYDIRILEVKHEDYDNEIRVVIQFHFTMWPDHGVPIFSSSLLTFINHTKEFHIPGKSQSPILVHCSAGVGRTGTFIVLDYFLEHLKKNDKVNVYKFVAQLRESRCLMVQTKDQYMFIHDAIQDIITCKDTFIEDHEFPLYVENAFIRDLNTMATPFEDKYELIMKTSRIIDPRDVQESSNPANVMKNRYPNFVPFDSHRVTIVPDQDCDTDYINASFVHSYQKHKGYIAAQSPLDSTVFDFWKMITKYRIQLIVMLSELVEDGHEMCAEYWPEEGKEMLVKYLVIRCEKEEVFDDFVRRKLSMSTQQGGINQTIHQLQFKKWKLNELPEISDLLSLYNQFTQVERGIKSKESPPILVHCDNGVTRTGTFIASINSIQQLQLERKVDIFQIVRNLRNSRPCMVPSLDLYILLFKLISKYIQSYEEKAYANFV
ncbi:hypothetical protein LOD99_6471 [Oopsacas minuta]|uniref:protein-tyrosine-phosphatase n=1 Tax=Oopsacas minuta TaxID=111878 RepID=A0AAV7JL79_9METZ|nr:hypothetical protein LOD99_6471 [Oopsacas minuta]